MAVDLGLVRAPGAGQQPAREHDRPGGDDQQVTPLVGCEGLERVGQGIRISRVFAEYPLADRAPVVEAQVVQPVGFVGGHEQEPVPFCLGAIDDRREDRSLAGPAVLVTRGLVGRDRKQQAKVGE